MTEELMNNFKGSIAGVNLIPSGGGVFEVIVDGDLIFSKKELGRFPNEQELSQLIGEKNLLQRSE
jgi:selenoprotein W-related protein